MSEFTPTGVYDMQQKVCYKKFEKEIGDPDRVLHTVSFAPLLPFVYLSTPETAGLVLGSPKQIDKGPLYDTIAQWIGYGLLIAKPKKWRDRRRLLTPTFHFNILQDFLQVMNEQTFIMADKLNKDVKSGKASKVDFYRWVFSIFTFATGSIAQVASNFRKLLFS